MSMKRAATQWSLWRTTVAFIVLVCAFSVIVSVLNLARSTLPMPYLEQITIPSRSNTGVMFQAPTKGLYIFEYAKGGFLVYDLPRGADCDRSAFKCFNAIVVAFRGTKVQWVGRDLNFPNALFSLGEANIGWTLEEAETQEVGRRASVNLNQNERMTLVAGDWRDAYDDNTGEITLNVYFVSS
jgi:hypothetical protein